MAYFVRQFKLLLRASVQEESALSSLEKLSDCLAVFVDSIFVQRSGSRVAMIETGLGWGGVWGRGFEVGYRFCLVWCSLAFEFHIALLASNKAV